MRLRRTFDMALLLIAAITLATPTAAAQAYRPVVSMSVTLPDGQVKELSAPESGLATVTVGDREYGLRPTMLDDQGSRIVVTIFDMGGATGPVREIGVVEVKASGPEVTSKTVPALKVRATKISK